MNWFGISDVSSDEPPVLAILSRWPPTQRGPASVSTAASAKFPSVCWRELAKLKLSLASINFCLRAVAGSASAFSHYRETYRDPQKDGVNKKRTLLTLHFQSMDRTLNSEEFDQAVATIIARCRQKVSAKLLG